MTASLTHRRRSSKLSAHVMLFAEDGNEHYGRHVWTLGTDLPTITDDVVAYAAEYYGVSLDEARDLVDPINIVDNAGAWDDAQFVSELWHLSGLDIAPGYRTQDGAVVLDRDGVVLRYTRD